jgi:hypothetical protein
MQKPEDAMDAPPAFYYVLFKVFGFKRAIPMAIQKVL